MAEYRSVTRFTYNIFNTLITTLSAQEGKIDAAYEAFETTLTTINANINNPEITKPFLEALSIECLIHLNRYSTMCAEYKAVLECIDVDALTKVLSQTPEGRNVGKEEVRKFLEEVLASYWEWWHVEKGEEEVERLRRDIANTVRIALTLLDEHDWEV
jgi:hypothetical protein